MTQDALPNDVETLKDLLLKARQSEQQSRQSEQQAQQQIAALADTIASQREQLDKQQQAIADLLAALRGKQRERFDVNQLTLFELDELESLLGSQQDEQEEQDQSPPKRRKKKGHGRRAIPNHWPREEVVYELSEEERACPIDGKVMDFIRYEISKQIDYIPPQFKVIVHKRAVYACPNKHDEAELLIAPKPPQPIEKGLAAPGLLAAVAVGKFGDHLPGYRLEDIFSRQSFGEQSLDGKSPFIRRSTIYDWLAQCADLVQPLTDRMASLVLQSKVIHTDDTQVKLIDKALRECRTARFWAYVGDRGHPYTVYDFSDTRERKHPQKFLQGFEGYLQADAYGGYDGIYHDSRGTIIEVACWAHCRRYWWKAREQDPVRSSYALTLIGELFKIEREAKQAGLDAAALRALRRQKSQPILNQFESWLDEQSSVLPKSLIGQARTYTRNQWQALRRYVEDGDLSMDNNLAERTVKPIAIGRKNWMYVGSMIAGERAARLMSLIASCKANRVEPWAYLRDVLKQLPLMKNAHREIPAADLDTLLPNVWLAQHPQHRWTIADTRAQERAKKGNL